MTAYAVVNGYGPTTNVICAACNLNDRYPRTRPAQEAAAEHNATNHQEN